MLVRVARTMVLGLVGWSCCRAAWGDPAAVVTSTQVPAAAAEAQARLKVAPGLDVGLWAAEPLVRDVTSLDFDAFGRAYVVESGRRRTSVFDVRNLQPWLDDDFALRTVEERAAFLRRMLTPGTPGHDAFLKAVMKSKFGDFNGDGAVNAADLEVEEERIRLVWDADGDGAADSARTFAEGFRSPVSGVAAGVLVRGPDVWFTCIPDLWKLPAAPFSDPQVQTAAGGLSPWRPGDPRAERVLSGFGVHIAFGGHDLHGLVRGPDGRIYFSIADRGSHVTTREGTVVAVPDTGAVFRCEPDGSRLEVMATGLRNPQELAFDDFGNLWTGDNNGDGGDKARWTLVVEGADYGWTIGWQWLPKMGAWNSERLWHTRESNSAAFLMPPVAHVGHGPAGIAHYPGTGLGPGYRDHFFFADFPGGVRTFRVEPDGAFFRVAGAGSWLEDNSAAQVQGKLLWNLAPVDVAFPPEGGVVVADAFPSWEKTGSARLWRVRETAASDRAQAAQVAALLRQGMGSASMAELAGWLGHPDQRIRLEAQWELAGRGDAAVSVLLETARSAPEPRPRLHAIWALGQWVRSHPAANRLIEVEEAMRQLLDAADPRIQEASLRWFGEAGRARWADTVLGRSRSVQPRVTAAALRAGSRLASAVSQRPGQHPQVATDWKAFAMMLPDLHPGDPVVREAKVAALTALAGAGINVLEPLERSGSAEAELLAVLAQRRLGRADALVPHLRSPHPQVVLEAVRALHDRPEGEGWKRLVPLLESTTFPTLSTEGAWPASLPFEPEEWRAWVWRRVVNAAFLLGDQATGDHAARLATVAAAAGMPESVRMEALEALESWGKPARRDRVLGVLRPRAAAPVNQALEALEKHWESVVASAPVKGTNAPVILSLLRAVESLGPARLGRVLDGLQDHPLATVRAEVGRLRRAAAPVTEEQWVARLENGSIPQQREALQAMAALPGGAGRDVLVPWMERLRAGQVDATLQVDVLEAARTAGGPRLEGLLADWENALSKDDTLARYRPALVGGDPAVGRRLFAERTDWGCQRCHRLGGEGGVVGPDLAGLGRARGAEYLLESIVHPNRSIAPGYENVVLTLKSGESVVGMVKSETETEVVVDTGEDGRVTVRKSDITSRNRALSSMVEGLIDLMTLRELRDLLAALME